MKLYIKYVSSALLPNYYSAHICCGLRITQLTWDVSYALGENSRFRFMIYFPNRDWHISITFCSFLEVLRESSHLQFTIPVSSDDHLLLFKNRHLVYNPVFCAVDGDKKNLRTGSLLPHLILSERILWILAWVINLVDAGDYYIFDYLRIINLILNEVHRTLLGAGYSSAPRQVNHKNIEKIWEAILVAVGWIQKEGNWSHVKTGDLLLPCDPVTRC